jgi:hypothetical protein
MKMEDTIMVSYSDYSQLKNLVFQSYSLDNRHEMAKLLVEIDFKNAINKEKCNNSKKMGLNIIHSSLPICNVEKEKHAYVLQQLDARDNVLKFIEEYCDFDLESEIKASELKDRYNTVNNENLTSRLVGLIITDLSKSYPLNKYHGRDGIYYKGLKFK